MTDIDRKDEFQGEVDLRTVLREVYDRKWMVLAATLLAGVAMAALSLFLPNTYSSSAALIIRNPQSPIADDIDPLNVETLQNLAESTDVKYLLFNQLWESQALDKWKTLPDDKDGEFRNFQGQLGTDLRKQESRGVGGAIALLPVLELNATASSPGEATTIANAWVDIITERCKVIYTQGVEDLGVFIGDVYQRADENLVKEEGILSEKTIEADLDLKKARFETAREQTLTLEDTLFKLEVEIRTNEVVMAGIEKRLAEQEYQGVWLGDAAEDLYLEGRLDEIKMESASPLATRIVNNVKLVVEQNDELLRFTTAARLEALQDEAESAKLMMNEATGNIAKNQMELATSQRDLENIRAALAEQEINGVWVGELLTQYYRDAMVNASAVPAAGTTPAPADAAAPASDAPQEPAKPVVTENSQRLDAVIKGLMEREFALQRYEQESGVAYKRDQLAIFETELERLLADKDAAQKSLVLTETRLAFLNPELERQPEKISLDKAITDDALWQEFLKQSPADGKAVSTPLKTEVLNPTHQRARDLVLDLTAETESLKQEIALAATREPELRKNIDTLHGEISAIEISIANQTEAVTTQRSVLDVIGKNYAANKEKEQMLVLSNRETEETIVTLGQARDEAYARFREKEEVVTRLQNQVAAKEHNLAAIRAALDVMAEDYHSERKALETLRLKQVRNLQERDMSREVLAKALEASEKLQVEIAQVTQDLTKTEREVKKLEGVRTQLATRAEEVALLKVATQNASRSGTTTLYRAQSNPQKVAPSRGMLVLAGMGATLFACGFLIYASTLIRLPKAAFDGPESV